MAKMTISVVKGRGSIAHNNRVFTTPNVDKDRVGNNIIYKAEPLEQAYEKCFGAEIERYNATQKRADRRIDGVQGYMEQVRTSKNGEKLFYETVVQVGNKHDCAVNTEDGDKAKLILNDYMQEFQRRNPNLYVFNAVLHLDEATPHLHIDYIPLARDYQRGLQVRNSLDKALKQQGIDGQANKRENSTHHWQEREKTAIEGIMREYGLERAPERGVKRAHMTVEQYKAVAEVVENAVEQIPMQIETAPTINKNRVSVRKSDLEQLEKRARLSIVHLNATKNAQRATEQTYAEGKQYVDDAVQRHNAYLADARKVRELANAELRQAQETRAKYEKLYSEQLNLNSDYEELLRLYRSEQQTNYEQNRTISALREENSSLKAQIEERVKSAVEPLKQRISELEKQVRGTCQSLANVVMAFGVLKYDKEKGYAVKLSEKQSLLFDAIEKYTAKWLRIEKQDDLAEDVEKRVGFSDGIKKHVQELTPKRTIDYHEH